MGANFSSLKTIWNDLPQQLPDIRLLTWANWDMIMVKLARRIVQFEKDLYTECEQIIEDMKNLSDIAQCKKMPRKLHSMESLPRMVTPEIERGWTSNASRAKVSRLKKELPFTPNANPVYVGSYYLNNAKAICGFWYANECNMKCTLKNVVLKAQRDLRENLEGNRGKLEAKGTFMMFFVATLYNYLDCKFKIYKRSIEELNKVIINYQDDILSIMNAAVQERERKPYIVLWGDMLEWAKYGLPHGMKETDQGISASGSSGIRATNPALRREASNIFPQENVSGPSNPALRREASNISPQENISADPPRPDEQQRTSDNTPHILQTNVSGKEILNRIKRELKIIVDFLVEEPESTIRKWDNFIKAQRISYALSQEVAALPKPYRRFHPYRRWPPPPSPLARVHHP